MKKTSWRGFYIGVILVLFLAACSPDLVITMPPEEATPTPEPAPPEEEPEPVPSDTPPVVEAGIEDMLQAGTAMKWYDDGYLVFVPKGEVVLGDNQYENNLEHTVSLDDYWIYMFPVTNGQYSLCVAAGACTPPAGEEPYPDITSLAVKDDPVVGVNWDQAGAYCQWMNGRLPTKAEWEKAARGPQAYTFPWGENDPTCDLLNFNECEKLDVSVVYEYPKGRSFYQAFDLAGNTYEWVFDLYEDDFISQLPGEEPYDPPHGTERSVRGSSYLSEEELLSSAQLFYLEPDQYRTDLGFRCVIGEAEPPSFAYPCVKSAFVPGLPAPWVPGPPPGDSELPDFPEVPCYVDIGTSHTEYCSNQALQQGGLDLNIAALGSTDVYMESWSSPQGVACIDGTDPLQCFGPEQAPITFEICATCNPGVSLESAVFTCDPGYILQDTTPPVCVYDACPPQPGPPCPAGFVYDQPNDICVKIGIQSTDCPEGYVYDPDSDCCTATFAPPAEDPNIPSASYLICPPGTGNVTLIGEIVVPNIAVCKYLVAGAEQEHCITRTFNLGQCARCTNPGSYTDKASCEAALCYWGMGPTGGYKCMYPK